MADREVRVARIARVEQLIALASMSVDFDVAVGDQDLCRVPRNYHRQRANETRL